MTVHTQLDLFGQVEATEARVAAEAERVSKSKSESTWHPHLAWRSRLVKLSSNGVLVEAIHRKTASRMVWFTTKTEAGAAIETFLNMTPAEQEMLAGPTEAYVLGLFEENAARIAAWMAVPGNYTDHLGTEA
jgi:hypothetical protein